MLFETVLNNIGSFGKYQKTVGFIALLLQFVLISNFCFMIFAGLDSELIDDKVDVFGTTDFAKNSTPKSQFYSIKSEWPNLSARIPSIVNSMQMAGYMIGTIPSGHLCDTYGRKRTLFWGMLSMCVTGFASAMSPNWMILGALRFVFGMSNSLYMAALVMLLVEITGASHRFIILVSSLLLWELGFCILSLTAYVTQHWRHMVAFTSLLYIPFLPTFWFIQESPRWLIHKGLVEQAETSLRRMALINGTKLEPSNLKTLQAYQEKCEQHTQSNVLWHYLRNDRTSFAQLVAMCVVSLVTFCVLYVLFFSTGDLLGNVYINVAAFGLIKIVPVSLIVLGDMKLHLGRKSLVCSGFMGACLCLTCAAVLNYMGMQNPYGKVITIIGSCFMLPPMVGCWLYPAELFPTLVRSRASAVVSTFSRLGSLFSPMILMVFPQTQIIPPVVAAGLTFVAFFVAIFWLPETRDKPLNEIHSHNPTSVTLMSVELSD